MIKTNVKDYGFEGILLLGNGNKDKNIIPESIIPIEKIKAPIITSSVF